MNFMKNWLIKSFCYAPISPLLFHYLLLQTRHTPALIPEKTHQVPFGRLRHHPLRSLLSCFMAPLLLLKVIALLVVLIWVNVKVAKYKDIQLNINVLFISYCRSLQLLLQPLDHNNNGNLILPNNDNLDPDNIGNNKKILPLSLLLKTLVGFSTVAYHTMLPLTWAIYLFILHMTILMTFGLAMVRVFLSPTLSPLLSLLLLILSLYKTYFVSLTCIGILSLSQIKLNYICR